MEERLKEMLALCEPKSVEFQIVWALGHVLSEQGTTGRRIDDFCRSQDLQNRRLDHIAEDVRLIQLNQEKTKSFLSGGKAVLLGIGALVGSIASSLISWLLGKHP